MNLKERLEAAKKALAAMKAAVESGEKSAEDLQNAIKAVEDLQEKIKAAEKAETLLEGLKKPEKEFPHLRSGRKGSGSHGHAVQHQPGTDGRRHPHRRRVPQAAPHCRSVRC